MIVQITDQAINQVACEGIVLHIFDEKRPARGGAGAVDWRLNGFLSRLLKEGHISGKNKEMLLLPSQGRLAAAKILVLGLGKPSRFKTGKLKTIWRQAGEALTNLHLSQLALAIPAQNSKLSYPEGGKLAQAIIGGLLEGIKTGGGKSGDFHLLLTNFDELRTKENKDSFRRQVSSFPGIQPIGF